MGRPAHVEHARRTNDTAALSAMGKNGAKKRFENVEGKRLDTEFHAEQDEALRRKDSGEDILPVDSIH